VECQDNSCVNHDISFSRRVGRKPEGLTLLRRSSRLISRALPFLLDSVLWAIISSDLTQHDVDSAQLPLRSTSRASALRSTGETAPGFPCLLLAGSFLHSSGEIFDTKTEHDFLVLVDANIVDPRASSGKGRASANANANVNAVVRLDVIRSLSPAGLSTYDGFTSGLVLK
jgi:hypothetical protein